MEWQNQSPTTRNTFTDSNGHSRGKNASGKSTTNWHAPGTPKQPEVGNRTPRPSEKRSLLPQRDITKAPSSHPSANSSHSNGRQLVMSTPTANNITVLVANDRYPNNRTASVQRVIGCEESQLGSCARRLDFSSQSNVDPNTNGAPGTSVSSTPLTKSLAAFSLSDSPAKSGQQIPGGQLTLTVKATGDTADEPMDVNASINLDGVEMLCGRCVSIMLAYHPGGCFRSLSLNTEN